MGEDACQECGWHHYCDNGAVGAEVYFAFHNGMSVYDDFVGKYPASHVFVGVVLDAYVARSARGEVGI